MTQETKEKEELEAEAALAQSLETAQAKEPETPPAPTLEELQGTIVKLTADLESAKTEAKSHQKFGQETKKELDRQRGLDSKVSGLETQLGVVVEMVADLIDKGGVDEELESQPKKRRSEEYLARLKRPAVDTNQQEALNLLGSYQKRVEALGLTAKDPEYRQVYRLARTLDPMDLADAEAIILKLETSKVADTTPKTEAKVDIAKEIQAGVQAELKRMGLLSSDTGTPGAGSISGTKIREDYVADPDNKVKRDRYLQWRKEQNV